MASSIKTSAPRCPRKISRKLKMSVWPTKRRLTKARASNSPNLEFRAPSPRNGDGAFVLAHPVASLDDVGWERSRSKSLWSFWESPQESRCPDEDSLARKHLGQMASAL